MDKATEEAYRRRLVVEAATDMLEGQAVNGHKFNDFEKALDNYGAASKANRKEADE